MLTLIYPFRNRDLERLKNSLESLKKQSDSGFEVFFVDYGSHKEIAEAAEKLCRNYKFVRYNYNPTQFQPWNKSRALNAVIKKLEIEFCFVADVDMIFHPQFIEKALKLQAKNKTIYFQVGFLKPAETFPFKEYKDYKIYRKSTCEATGLSMFPVKILKELRGFDEFYHFWGAEDTDMHVRIKNNGYEVEFYDKEILLLHQWHSSYRSYESEELSKHLQISGIVQLNHQHLKHALEYKTTKVNWESWGESITNEDLIDLEKAHVNLILNNDQIKIDHLLYAVMPETKNGIFKIIIKKDPFQNSLKYLVKKLLRKKVPRYYSLKEINDKILLHLISFYRNNAYHYKISDDLKSIELIVRF